MVLPSLQANLITTVSFDLDDTLWDNKPVLDNAEKSLYDWLKNNAPKLTEHFSVDDFKQHRMTMAKKNPELSHDMTRQRYISLLMLAQEHNYSEGLVTNAIEVFLQARNEVELYEDVIPVLVDLKNNYDLVALSNGNSDIRKIGIHEYFECSLSPSDTGTSKPDPAIFEHVMKKMNLTPEMLIHVGDEPATDIIGAQRAGIRNIWLNRNNQHWPEAIAPPDVEINSLYELIPALGLFD